MIDWAVDLIKCKSKPANPLQEIMIEIAEWSDKTFGEGERNPAILHHLRKEVPELILAFEEFQINNTIQTPYYEGNRMIKNVWEEYADCMMLLLDSAHHFGMNAERLLYVTKQKLEKNKKRKWGNPDCNGVIEHIRQ
jgi:NTP pyrophosphatase (non-canonical NTP hydrolase)